MTLRELTNQPIPKRSIKQESLDIIVQPDMNIPEFYNEDAGGDSDSSETTSRKQTRSSKDSNMFTCTYCQKVLRTKKGLKIHQRRHTGEKLRSCHICQAKFTRTNHLRRHLETHNKANQDSSAHVCGECGASFTRAYHLLKHKREHKLVTIKKESFNEDIEDPNNIEDEIDNVDNNDDDLGNESTVEENNKDEGENVS